jgi:hypothetical protein
MRAATAVHGLVLRRPVPVSQYSRGRRGALGTTTWVPTLSPIRRFILGDTDLGRRRPWHVMYARMAVISLPHKCPRVFAA